ncbi:MAG: hypothetical protein QW517_04595 [Thermofilaceae archaeon]
MCPVVIASKTRYTGAVTPLAIGVETTVVDIPPQADDYMVEGYIDLALLTAGDSVLVKELVALDGGNFRAFTNIIYTGPVDEPVVRFHTKTLPAQAGYRVTVTPLTGNPRQIPYAFIVEVLGIL